MTYLILNDDTAEGRKILAGLRKSKCVKILRYPNEETRKALRAAKNNKGLKEIKDTQSWLNKLLQGNV